MAGRMLSLAGTVSLCKRQPSKGSSRTFDAVMESSAAQGGLARAGQAPGHGRLLRPPARSPTELIPQRRIHVQQGRPGMAMAFLTWRHARWTHLSVL